MLSGYQTSLSESQPLQPTQPHTIKSYVPLCSWASATYTSNLPIHLSTKMSVQKANPAKPRKPAAKKTNKKAVYQCSVPGCLKLYFWASGLYNHTQLIHLRRKHFCDVPGCLKLFSLSSGLYRHQRIAHQGRRYDCGVPGCLQSHTSTWMLSIHQQTIRKKQGFHCAIPGCLKSYSSPSALTNHQYSDYWGRRYQCDMPGCTIGSLYCSLIFPK